MIDEAKSKRDAAIERVRKLQAMTTARGASEAEAMMASARISALRTEYGIAESDLSIRADTNSCVKDALVSVASDEPGWRRVAINIEKLYGTICWLEQSEEDLFELGFKVKVTRILYYGFPLDVAASIATLALIGMALDSELTPERTRGKGRGYRGSFTEGFCNRVNARLHEMRVRSSKAFHDASKGALVVVKEQVVRSEFEKLGQKLYRSQHRAPAWDRAGYAAGQAAGGRVGLDAQVAGGNSAPKQIGGRS